MRVIFSFFIVLMLMQHSYAETNSFHKKNDVALVLFGGSASDMNYDAMLHEQARATGVVSVFDLRQYGLDYFIGLKEEQILHKIKYSTSASLIYYITKVDEQCIYDLYAKEGAVRNYNIESHLMIRQCNFSKFHDWNSIIGLRPAEQLTEVSQSSVSESGRVAAQYPKIYYQFTEREVEKINSTQQASVSRAGTVEELAQASEVVVYSYPITAEENIDYVPFSKVIRFEPGQTRVLFTFEVFESDGVADEFGIGLRYPVNAVIPDEQSEGSKIIVKLFSDVVKDEFKISYPELRFYSEGEEYTLTVSRGNTQQTQSVEYTTDLDGLGSEFTTSKTNFVFTPGVEKMELKFIVIDDFRFNRELRSATFNFKETPKIVFPQGTTATFQFSDNNKSERGVFGFEYTKYVVENNSPAPEVKIIRTASTKGSASFNYSVKDESNSYSKEGVVTFADGDFEKTLSLEGAPKENSVIKMELTPSIDVVMSNSTAEIKYTKVNDGGAGVDQVMVESSALNADENIGDFIFPLRRLGSFDYLGVVTVKDAGGTAKEGVDYSIKSNTLSYGVGVQVQSIQLVITNDEVFTGGKQIKLALSSPNLKVPTESITVNIVEDDFEKLGTVSFKVSQMSVEEEQTNVPVVITRDLPGPGFDFDISLISGTAIVGKDVQPLENQKVRFESGETQLTVYLNMIGDTIPDFDKEFTVKIASNQPIRFGTSSMKITVIDNEKAKAIYVKPTGQGIVAAQGQVTSLSTSAGDKMVKVTLTRTVNTSEAFRLFVKSSDGSARAGVHYSQVDESLLFGQGETTKTITLVLKKSDVTGSYQDFDLNFSADTTNFIVESPALKVKITPTETITAPGEGSSGGSSGGVFGGLLAALLVMCIGRRKVFLKR